MRTLHTEMVKGVPSYTVTDEAGVEVARSHRVHVSGRYTVVVGGKWAGITSHEGAVARLREIAAEGGDDVRAPFIRHDDGMVADLNIIDPATGVQIWTGPSYTGPGIAYRVGVPASARNSGTRCKVIVSTLDEAYAAAEALRPAAARSMARRHAEALRMNGGK